MNLKRIWLKEKTMTANDTLKEIGRQFMEADSILLFPHENVDGDALGSCAALCKALRKELYQHFLR